jgi:large subunit ribosomal protein L18
MRKKRVIGTAQRPRLSTFRGLNNLSVQVIDDTAGRTLAAATTAEKGLVKYGGNVAAAKVIGKLIAERALAKGIKKVVFDRGAALYHGRIKALADAAREGGLEF